MSFVYQRYKKNPIFDKQTCNGRLYSLFKHKGVFCENIDLKHNCQRFLRCDFILFQLEISK